MADFVRTSTSPPAWVSVDHVASIAIEPDRVVEASKLDPNADTTGQSHVVAHLTSATRTVLQTVPDDLVEAAAERWAQIFADPDGEIAAGTVAPTT